MNILKYVFDKFGCKHEAYDKKDIDNKIKTINDSLSSINTNITSANTKITNLQTKDNELNTKITNLQNNVYVKGNFAILEGSINIQTHATGRYLGTTEFTYPTGFTRRNSVVISYMISTLFNTSNESYNTSMGISSNNYVSSTLNVGLNNTNIDVTGFDSTASGNHPIKIVLFKYK